MLPFVKDERAAINIPEILCLVADLVKIKSFNLCLSEFLLVKQAEIMLGLHVTIHMHRRFFGVVFGCCFRRKKTQSKIIKKTGINEGEEKN